MLELIGKLKDLKNLVGERYYDDVKNVVLALLGGDWQGATGLLFDLAKKVVLDQLFGMQATVSVTSETELDEKLSELEEQTVHAAGFNPGTWLTIIVTVIEIIKKFRQS